MTDAFPYTRVGPRAGGWLGKSSLWLGADHLLLIRNHYFTEDYLRFHLRDIQAIIVRKQMRFSLPLSGILLLVFAIVVVIVLDRTAYPWIAPAAWTAAAILTALWLAVSVRWSCSCHIQTAVGVQEIPSLRRIWRARPALRLLEEKISQAQGVLPEDWHADDRVALAESQASTAAPEAPPALTSRPVIFVAAALAGVLVDALYSWLIWSPHASPAMRGASLAVTLVAIGMCVFAVVAIRRDPRLAALRKLLLFSIVAVGVINYGSIVLNTAMVQLGVQTSFNVYFYWANEAVEAIIVVVGFFLLMDVRRGEPSAP